MTFGSLDIPGYPSYPEISHWQYKKVIPYLKCDNPVIGMSNFEKEIN